MAKVYLALLGGPAGFNKLLVIKVLRDDVMNGSEEGVRMFWDEARLAARLVHPNIVHTFEVGEIEGRYFLAMEYLDGQTYREVQNRARSTGALKLHDELRILSELARGLHYSHELKGFNGEPLGVVHRDVSPQNVFLTYDGQVKLLDFGIAKSQEAEHMTQVGVIKGKLDYIAPEQLRGETLDGRADVFALGAMLWEAIAGQRFAGGRKVTDVTKVHLRLSGGEAKIREVKPDISEELATIVDRAIAVDPAARYADAAAFADALDAYLEATGSKPTAKSLAALMGPLFQADRAAMHKLIDEQVKLTKSGVTQLAETTGELPQLGGKFDQSASGVYLGDGSSSGRRDLSIAAETPIGTPTQPKRRSYGVLSTVVSAAVVGAAVALYVVSNKPPPAPIVNTQPERPTAPAPAASAPSAPIAVAPSASDSPRLESTVTFGVKVLPQEAQVTLDGAPLPVPFSGEFRKSAALHHVEASAEGYRTFKRLISFDQDRSLEIVLDRNPQPVVRRPSTRNEPTPRVEAAPTEPREEAKPAAPAAAVDKPIAPGGELTPVKSRVRRGELDLSDPYSTK
jgi:eukaryotic-like serine/threonine-protein kinase